MHRALLATCATLALAACGGGGANEADPAAANDQGNALPPIDANGVEANRAAEVPPAELPNAGSQPAVRPDRASAPVAIAPPPPPPPPPPIRLEPIRVVPAPPPPPIDHNGMDHNSL